MQRPDPVCARMEKLVPGYLNHDLKPAELAAFIDHISTCRSCYDELETSFFVRKVTEQLDDDPVQDEPLDIRRLLEEDIAHSRRVIQMHRVERTIIRTGLPLGILLLGAFLFLLLSELVM